MKRSIFLILLIPVLFSCQSNNFASYQMSWAGWAIVIASVLGAVLIFVLKKGVVDDAEEKNAKLKASSALDFEPIGNYIGGHPVIHDPVPGIVFRKNSNCCLFFYKNHSYDLPELKFKIKIGSFRNVSVEDPSLSGNKLLSDRIALSEEAIALMEKKGKDQSAILKIDWVERESKHSTLFSFDGNDAVKKANTAKENLLQAIN